MASSSLVSAFSKVFLLNTKRISDNLLLIFSGDVCFFFFCIKFFGGLLTFGYVYSVVLCDFFFFFFFFCRRFVSQEKSKQIYYSMCSVQFPCKNIALCFFSRVHVKRAYRTYFYRFVGVTMPSLSNTKLEYQNQQISYDVFFFLFILFLSALNAFVNVLTIHRQCLLNLNEPIDSIQMKTFFCFFFCWENAREET